MAIISIDGEEAEVADGSAIMDACEDLGVPFGCRSGQCALCTITVLEGMENLDAKSQQEIDIGLDDNQRLACQAVIKTGTVVAEY